MRLLNTSLIRVPLVVVLGVTSAGIGCAKNPSPDASMVPGGPPAAPSAVPSGVASALSAAAPFLSSLTSAIPGLSQAQAILGAGSLLGLAKGKMPGDQFSQIASAIPGAEAMIGEAVKKGLPKVPSGLSAVTEFLGKSGISPSVVSQLVPALGSAVQGKVPADVASAFLSALS